jgi:predicted nucleic acid-binding protein
VTTLIDSSLWIDFTRSRSPASLKQFVAPYLLHPAAHIAEPITFEILRHATPKERARLIQQFETFPLLATPPDLWVRATELGQLCRDKGHTVGSLDLLISAVAMAHAAVIITFDEDFQALATIAGMQIKLLRRPG